MPSSVLVLGDLRDGKLRIDNLPALTRWITTQPDGARFRALFELTDLTKRGRLETFYRRILLPQAAEHLGYDVPEMHEVFYRALFLAGATFPPEPIKVVMGQLSDQNLSRYVQDAVRIASEQGVVLSERP